MIKFNCPHCEKLLSVKDENAGRRGKCPKCQQIIQIPAPGAVSADVEELAAATLGEQAPAKEEAPRDVGTITFTCPMCDEQVSVPGDLAGKQAPCPNPECRRIIKVPERKKEGPRDWRTVTPRGPAAGLRKDEQNPAPEGAWGTAVSTSRVSQQSLVEAEVIPVYKERLTPTQWAKRVFIVVVVVAVGYVGWSIFTKKRAVNYQERALTQAREHIKDTEKLDPLTGSEVYRAATEFYLRAGDLTEARQFFDRARNRVTQVKAASTARDVQALEVALTAIDLYGKKIAVPDRGKKTQQDDLGQFQKKDMLLLVQQLSTPDARAAALPEITRRLLLINQGGLAPTLVSNAADNPTERANLLALVGLELQRAGLTAEAQTAADTAFAPFNLPAGPQGQQANRPPPALALVALLLVLDHKPEAEAVVPAPKGPVNDPAPDTRIAYSLAWAWQGRWEEARQLAGAKGFPAYRFQALANVAGVALAKEKPDEARQAIEQALAVLAKEPQAKEVPGWTLRQLAGNAARLGMAEQAQPVADAIGDDALRDRANADLVRAKLEKVEQADLPALESAAKEQPARHYVLEARARQAARVGDGAALYQSIETWPSPSVRAFGYLGLALGEQDRLLP